nr:NADPH-dependent FMN reductase [uncultured Cohaesibacter sp.]
MTKTLKVAGICGSLREGAYSRSLMEAMVELLPEGTEFNSVDIGSIPHYNQDQDTANGPEAVLTSRSLIAESDAVLITLPEFNHGIPGVLKNALDWLSRPAFTSCFTNKPVLFATIAPGPLGGVRAQAQMRETLSCMLCKMLPLPEIAVTFAGQKFPNGKLEDEATTKHLQTVIGSFLDQADLR